MQDLSTIDYDKVDAQMSIVQLCSGETAKGEAFWAYIAMKPSCFLDYKAKKAMFEPINLEEYGQILSKGFGVLPPPEIQEEMKVKHGIDHGFEQLFTEHLEAATEKKS